jgi:hypothetical protein
MAKGEIMSKAEFLEWKQKAAMEAFDMMTALSEPCNREIPNEINDRLVLGAAYLGRLSLLRAQGSIHFENALYDLAMAHPEYTITKSHQAKDMLPEKIFMDSLDKTISGVKNIMEPLRSVISYIKEELKQREG